MEPVFWVEKWKSGQLGFHQTEVHPDLLRFGEAWLQPERRVLVPLCGKSVDLVWLAERVEVLAVELVEQAVEAFFSERGLETVRQPAGPYVAWSSPALPGLTVLQGDIFALGALPSSWNLSGIHRVWDRAALVALTRPQRAAYAALLRALLPPGTAMLLNVFDLGPDTGEGPPHSVQQQELEQIFAGCTLELLQTTESAPSPAMVARGFLSLLTLTWRVVFP